MALALAPWLVIRLLELGVLFVRPAAHSRHWGFSILDALTTWLIWCGILGGLGLPLLRRNQWIRNAVLSVVALVFGFMLVSSWLIYDEFGEFISVGMLAPLRSDWASVLDYVLLFLRGWTLAGFAVLAASCFWFFRRLSINAVTSPGLVVLPVILSLAGLNWIQKHSTDRMMSVESSHWVTLKALRKLDSSRILYQSHHRIQVPAFTPAEDAPNVLVILGESWGATGLPFFPGPDGKGSPLAAAPDLKMSFLEGWIAKEADNFLFAPRAYSHSTDTKVSVPAIMTGVSPERPVVDLHSSPFIWDWARAAGYRAFYYTSERYRWAGFDQFFIRGFPGSFFTADTEDHPLVNDLGIDDGFTVRSLLRQFSNLRPGERFFAVFNPNAIHGPFQEVSVNYAPFPESITTRFSKAHWILDKAIEELVLGLKAQGRLDSTAIFFTGDHGPGFGIGNEHARLFNLRDKVIRIPWMVRLPRGWAKNHAGRVMQARQNLERTIGNVDILPSVVSMLMPRHLQASYREGMSLWSGFSVFDATVPRDRILVSLIPKDGPAGSSRGAFSVVRGQFRVMYDVRRTWGLYDVAQDPAQLTNLWDSSEYRSVREELKATISRTEELRRISDSH